MEHEPRLPPKATIRQYSEIMTDLIAEPREALSETHTGEGPVRQPEMDVLNAVSMLNSVVITEARAIEQLAGVQEFCIKEYSDSPQLYDVNDVKASGFFKEVMFERKAVKYLYPGRAFASSPVALHRSRKDVPTSIPYLISWKLETTETQGDAGADDEAVKAANGVEAAALAAAVGAPLNLIAGT
ncbi:hypothetical protein EDD21DRAFT_414402 [Dissophora ornata]|nr:hypothetical protein EDD21DRAFT_414402 [Dissophora ornata]